MTNGLSPEGIKFVKDLVARVENIESEKRILGEDVKDIYADAKDKGYDVKALKALIRRRRKNPKEIENEEDMVELYEGALEGFEPIV